MTRCVPRLRDIYDFGGFLVMSLLAGNWILREVENTRLVNADITKNKTQKYVVQWPQKAMTARQLCFTERHFVAQS